MIDPFIADSAEFAGRLLSWYDRHGRHALPWKIRHDAYAVWLSEIMLQQTQVVTVIPYYQRFLQRFHTIASLAEATLDEVLQYWAGLGYYARARHLHRAARQIVAKHQGCFPDHIDAVLALPGIGRSTAGAILVFAFGQHHAILDGNVKRVLARVHRLPGRKSATELRRLWALAEYHTPPIRAGDYAQAIMDFGATLCRRRHPDCQQCPVAGLCAARVNGSVDGFPRSRRRAPLPQKQQRFLILRRADGCVLLQKRPPTGIWGGLWCLPDCALDANIRGWLRDRFGLNARLLYPLAGFTHTFSHFRLQIHPVVMALEGGANGIMESVDSIWYNPKAGQPLAAPKPVLTLIEQVSES